MFLLLQETWLNKQIDDIQTDADKKIDIARTDSKESIAQLRQDAESVITAERDKLDKLDQAVSDVLNANKSFFNEEQEAAKLKEAQKPERGYFSSVVHQGGSNEVHALHVADLPLIV